MEEAQRKAGAESDNLSVVALTWERQDEDLPEVGDDGTVTEPMAGFSSTMNTAQEFASVEDEISDAEIEKAITEIQSAIKKVSR
jgi:hypothetical protein